MGAKKVGCFDLKIEFQTGWQSTKPNGLSRKPALSPFKEYKPKFGQLPQPENITPETFQDILVLKTFFEDKKVQVNNTKH